MIQRRRQLRNELRQAPQSGPWQAPPELLRSVPRPARLTGAGKIVAGFAVFLAAAALASGVLLYAFATRDQARNARRASEGVSTQAEVYRLSRTGGDHPERVVRYRYTAGGRVYNGRVSMGLRESADLEVGSPLTVQYLPDDPGRSWLPGRLGGVPVWTIAVVPPPLACWSFLIAALLRRQRRLLREGHVAGGRVVEVKRVHTGHHSGYRMVYEYTTLSGAVCTRRLDVSHKPLPAGSALAVIYDPDRPQRSAPYPFPLVTVR